MEGALFGDVTLKTADVPTLTHCAYVTLTRMHFMSHSAAAWFSTILYGVKLVWFPKQPIPSVGVVIQYYYGEN